MKVHLGDSAEITMQAAVSETAQQGYSPVKILFSRQGLLDFKLSVMVERDLQENNAPKVEYRFLKKLPATSPKR